MILQLASATKDRGAGVKTKSKSCAHCRDWLQTVVRLPEVLQDAWHQGEAPAVVGICRSCRDVRVVFFADAGDHEEPLTAKDVRDFLRNMRPKGRAA